MLTRSHRGDERGVTVVFVALCLTVLLGAAAFAVDLGSSRQIARRVQSSVDAASLAGAQQLPLRLDGTDAPMARQIAAGYTARNLHGQDAVAVKVDPCPAGVGTVAANTECFTSKGSFIVIESPYAVAGQVLNARHFVYVEVCEETPTYFAGAFGASAPDVCRSAVGRRYQAGLSYGRGLLTIDPTACPGLEIQGDSDIDIISDGGVFVDSTCSTAMEGTGNKWELSASIVSMVGDFHFNSCSDYSCTSGMEPLYGQPPIGDPLADVPEPAMPGTPAVCTTADKVTTCTPGYYLASPQDFGSGNGSVVLQPGIHWFSDGVDFGNLDVSVAGPESVDPDLEGGEGTGTGSGVLLYVSNGMLDLSGNGEIDLDPPTTGTYEGISVFTSRSNSSTAKITGTTGSTIGTIYTPKARLELGGNTDWEIEGMVVAGSAYLFGSMDLWIDPDEPAGAIPPEEDLGLEL